MPTTTGSHDPDGWVARRRQGESVAQIAATDGVSPATVSRATSHAGPFPHPRTVRARQATHPLAQQWAQARRAGVSTTRIAAANDVCHQWVSRVTAPLGPYPTPRRGATL